MLHGSDTGEQRLLQWHVYQLQAIRHFKTAYNTIREEVLNLVCLQN